MQPVAATKFTFEGFMLDLEQGSLCNDHGEIELRPKSFQVLRYLVANAGRLVAKEELLQAMWPNVMVSEESLSRCISDVRSALQDVESRIIKTVPRRGYRFTAPVTASEASTTNPVASDAEVLTAPGGPSIAVLPFANMSGDPEQEYFADGMVEEITTALSRFKNLLVIARNSSFTYKGNASDVKQVGRELGVRYVLEGSVRKAANRVRITTQLINASTGAHLWADRFEGAIEGIFELQDQVTKSVVGAITPTVERAEIGRAVLKPTDNLVAYDHYMRGIASAYR
jgi:TolB-like protein